MELEDGQTSLGKGKSSGLQGQRRTRRICSRDRKEFYYFPYCLSEIYHLVAACRFFKVRAGLFLYLNQWSVWTGEVSQQLASWRH